MPKHKPFAYKMEMVRGCTLRCPFCSLRKMTWAEQPYEYMSQDLFQRFVDAVAAWTPEIRLELDERGEPSLHPRLPEFVWYARVRLPRSSLMLTTNGDLIETLGEEAYREWMLGLFGRGINQVLLDCYTRPRVALMRRLFPEAKDFYELDFNPYYRHKPSHKALIIKDASPQEVTRELKSNAIQIWHNQGGNVDPELGKRWGILYPEEPLKKMCVKPFREFTVHYDGAVPICCYDWREVNVVGRFPERSLPELWEAMEPARRHLWRKNRAGLKPCDKCTVKEGSWIPKEHGWFAGDPTMPVMPRALEVTP